MSKSEVKVPISESYLQIKHDSFLLSVGEQILQFIEKPVQMIDPCSVTKSWLLKCPMAIKICTLFYQCSNLSAVLLIACKNFVISLINTVHICMNQNHHFDVTLIFSLSFSYLVQPYLRQSFHWCQCRGNIWCRNVAGALFSLSSVKLFVT